MLIQNDDQFLTVKTLGYIISIQIINNTIIKTIKIKKIIKIGNIIINHIINPKIVMKILMIEFHIVHKGQVNNVIGQKIVLSIGFSKNVN